MFLSLEHPGGDKHVSLFGRNLAGDADYEPCSPSYLDWDAGRSRVNRAVNGTNEALGKDRQKAFSMLFNQFTWKGTTGWEYWSKDYVLMLKHALLVADALGEPLHVHRGIMDAVIDAALALELKFDFKVLNTLLEAQTDEVVFINRQIEAGEYFVLTDVVLPAGLTRVDIG